MDTKYHGTINFNEEDVITFNKGIPGFENLKKFVYFEAAENDAFTILHSVEDNKIGLVCVNPFICNESYEFKLTDEILEVLKIKDNNDVLILNTVTLNSDVKKITVNLKAPIIININSKLGEQIILSDEKYEIKHPLIRE